MKLCPNCDQAVAEEINTCPSCGSQIGEGRKYVDDYRIVDVVQETHASLVCRGIRLRTAEMVMIRLYTPESGVDENVALRLNQELEELKKLPEEGFVRHYAIRQAPDGLWYRISEWLETESWGSLLASGRLSDHRVLFDLFHQMALALSVLHREGYFIPHLILNDIIPINGYGKGLQVKIDYKLFRFFDPKLDRPGSMLEKLLRCHPDVINHRPLDFRSDIWSLGKVFVELLTADLEGTNFIPKVEELNLPREAEVLLKVMLADDPDMRPRSMAEVAEALGRIKEDYTEKAKNSIIRYIEFPSEYHRAGIGILTYFGTILRKKYPNSKAKVRIEQEGLKVSMIIDSAGGDREVIEQTLDEYGLVIKGDLRPEEFMKGPLEVIELKQELRMAYAQIGFQKDLLGHKDDEIKNLRNLLSQSVGSSSQPGIGVNIEVSPKFETKISQNVQFANNISLIRSGFDELIKQLKSGSEEYEKVKEIQQDLKEIEKAESPEEIQNTTVMSKIKDFLENVNNAGTKLNKVVRGIENGFEIAQRLAKYYNNVAQWCGFPQVPQLFLKKKSAPRQNNLF